MNFVDSIKSTFLYANSEGRASRSEYWFFAVFLWILSIVLYIAAVAIPFLGYLILFTAFIFLVYPTITLSIRRFDMRGWWLLIGLVPILGLIVVLYWSVKKGSSGENDFGPDPLGVA